MNVAFYAPLKAPDHPVPSGDRRIARLLCEALEASGHRVALAARLRSWDGGGDARRQERIREVAQRLAARLLRRYRALARSERPQCWFTYHLYHKAPDWIGPRVARALRIPYVLAEASFAPKQADGPWRIGHTAVRDALAAAAAVVTLNPADAPCVTREVGARRVVRMAPFLHTRRFGRATPGGRACWFERLGLAPEQPLLVAVAMMRAGAKLASYRVLAAAMSRILDRPWQLVLVGDGPRRPAVEAAFAGFDRGRVVFAGVRSGETLRSLLGAADLFVWPAVDEAMGMALLEAQATGLPVVAGASGGVPDLVRDGVTGRLAPPGDAAAFAAATAALLEDPRAIARLGREARAVALAEHDIGAAAERLDDVLRRVSSGLAP